MFERKQVFKLNILKKLLDDENGCVSLVPTTRVLALPPFFLNDLKSGILYQLNYMLKKYDRSLGGIVIGYQNIKVLMDENTGIIPMGTSEIEVNISVEFYIFLPKIGSFLKGIVNKKSNNHIGCLVHQYFNATILKPEDVEFEDWICKDFNVDDKIIFKVKDLDFTTLLPYIEGVVEDFQKQTSECISEMSDVSDAHKDVQDVTQKLLTRLKSDDSDGKCSENTKVTSANEEKVQSLEMSMNRLTNSQINTKKVEKKKRESGHKKQKCQPSRGEDNLLSSTQLEPNLKPMIWFFSPISHLMSSDGKDANGKNVMPVSDLSMVQDSPSEMKKMEKEKKKKHKKRRREEEDELESGPKKVKMSETDTSIEELCKKQVNTAVKDLKESGKTNREGKKNAKKMLKQNEELVACVSNVNGSGKTSNEHDMFCELSEQNLSGKKESGAFGKDSVGKKSKEDARNKSLKVKNHRKNKPGEVGSCEEEKKTTEKLTDSAGQKPKTAENDREGTNDSLYKIILEKAKNELLEKYKPSTSSPSRDAGKIRNKKDSELSDISAGSSKSKHSRKKTKHKANVKDGPGGREEFKNGSMYDLPSSPEKPDYDKSLFTDSEQSLTSPAKKRKHINGTEAAVSEQKPREQAKVNLFSTEQTPTTKSESDREVSKHLKKSKAKRKAESTATPRESLFEKLLEQAKRLIDIKEESPSEKKGKSGNVSKKAPSEDLKR